MVSIDVPCKQHVKLLKPASRQVSLVPLILVLELSNRSLDFGESDVDYVVRISNRSRVLSGRGKCVKVREVQSNKNWLM